MLESHISSAAGNCDIYWQETGSGNIRNLTGDCLEDDTQPAFSPDGEWIAFQSQRNGGGIYLMNPDGTNQIHLTEGGGFGTMEWIP